MSSSVAAAMYDPGLISSWYSLDKNAVPQLYRLQNIRLVWAFRRQKISENAILSFFLYKHLFIYRGLQHAQCRLMFTSLTHTALW